MRIHRRLLAVAALAVLAASAGAASLTSAAPSPARLRAFEGCPSFLAYVRKEALPLVGPSGLGSGVVGIGATAPPGPARDAVAGAQRADADFSGTNVQEEGVDEPDLVKTDGRTLFVVSDGRGQRARRPLAPTEAPRLAAPRRRVGARAAPRPQPPDRPVAGDADADPDRRRRRDPRTTVAVPLEDRAHRGRRRPAGPSARAAHTELDGGYLTARLVGHVARVVPVLTDRAEHLPSWPRAAQERPRRRATEQNRAVVQSAGARSWLPSRTLRGPKGRILDSGPIVQCRNVRRPTGFSGLGMVTVLTVDLARGLDPIDADAIVSNGRVVYASRSSLYVATDRFDPRAADGRPVADGVTTAIHRFDISSPTQTSYHGSATFAGVLLNQWSLSEWNGTLRVASTEQPVWWGGPQTESQTTVTTSASGKARWHGSGAWAGSETESGSTRCASSGTPGTLSPSVKSTRSTPSTCGAPSRPVVRGELKTIRGYLAYLHPVGDDLLLGIGRDATDDGRVLGRRRRSSTSRTSAAPSGSTRSRSATVCRRPSRTTTRSSGGPGRGSP